MSRPTTGSHSKRAACAVDELEERGTQTVCNVSTRTSWCGTNGTQPAGTPLPRGNDRAYAREPKLTLVGEPELIFFFNDTATTEIYTLSLHDALPISATRASCCSGLSTTLLTAMSRRSEDRKSTRLNSSHVEISYAVFCLKKKRL